MQIQINCGEPIMLYNRFVRIVEEHAEALTKSWIKEIKGNPSTPSYRGIADKELHDKVHDVYRRLGHWITERASMKEVAEHFMLLGRQRALQGIRQSEVIYALILSRVELWRYVKGQGIINDAMDLNRALEFFDRITYFYDKAIYFVSAGYENTEVSEEKLLEQGGMFEKIVKSFEAWVISE